MLVLGCSRLVPLPIHFVKKNCRGGADVERVNMRGHGDRHRFIAGGEHGGGNAIAFAAQNEAAVAGEIRL